MSTSAALASPSSETGSLVFEDGISSDGIPSPDEPIPPVAPPATVAYDGAKGVASAGLDLHSPLPLFVGTPFANGPTPLFEYPFPAAPSIRPSLSATSSLASVSSLHGPPSPSTRMKQHPFVRLSSKSSISQPTRRRFSNGAAPQIRVPPRLRTDSGSSVASSVVDEPTPAISNSPPLRTSPLLRLRDRSGSLGVLPIQLPPPIIACVRPAEHPNDSIQSPSSPAQVVGAMAASGLSSVRSPLRRSISQADEADIDERPSPEQRRMSMPLIFALRERDREDEQDETDTPTSYKSQVEPHLDDDLSQAAQRLSL